MRRNTLLLHSIIIILAHKVLSFDFGAVTAGCDNAYYDMLFIIDSSASVGQQNFDKVLRFGAGNLRTGAPKSPAGSGSKVPGAQIFFQTGLTNSQTRSSSAPQKPEWES